MTKLEAYYQYGSMLHLAGRAHGNKENKEIKRWAWRNGYQHWKNPATRHSVVWLHPEPALIPRYDLEMSGVECQVVNGHLPSALALRFAVHDTVHCEKKHLWTFLTGDIYHIATFWSFRQRESLVRFASMLFTVGSRCN